MHDSETDRFVDQLLTASLAGYAAEEPRTGLEQRILVCLSEAPQSPARLVWRWLPAGALAVVVMLALALLLPPRETTRVARPPSAAHPSAASAPLPPAVSTAEVRPTRPRRAPQSPTALVRAAQFPTPDSLTEEERLLTRFLDSSAREVLVASVHREEPLLDLQVRDLEVPLLELKPLPEQSGEAMEN